VTLDFLKNQPSEEAIPPKAVRKKRTKPAVLSLEQRVELQYWLYATLPETLGDRFFLVQADVVNEGGRWFIRLYLERADHREPEENLLPRGVSPRILIDECAALSHAVAELLDANPLLEELPYHLEISSPGLFRELLTEREFTFYKGKRVRLEWKLKKPKKATAEVPSLVALHLKEGVLRGYDSLQEAILVEASSTGKNTSVKAEMHTIPLKPGSELSYSAVKIFLNPKVDFCEDVSLPEKPELLEGAKDSL
jgi:ribosome maturation factor RimP